MCQISYCVKNEAIFTSIMSKGCCQSRKVRAKLFQCIQAVKRKLDLLFYNCWKIDNIDCTQLTVHSLLEQATVPAIENLKFE